MIRRFMGLALAAGLLLTGCQTPVHDRDAEVQPPLVWPPAPDAARITFVRAIRRPDDLGIHKNFFEQLRDVVFGGSEAKLVRPMAVVESAGTLFVADPGARGVHRFNTVDGRYDLIQLAHDEVLPSPVGLARGAGGEIYVTDSKLAQVLVIRPGAKAAEPLPLGRELHQPTGIAFDTASGRLFVVDTTAHCIQVYDRTGKHLKTLGSRGTGDGQFNFPTMLWRSAQGRLYVTDSLNFRVQILSEAGQMLGKFGRHGDGTGDAAVQKGIATDRYGHIYVVDSLFHAIQVFDEAGRFLLPIGGLGQDRGEFWLPTGVFIGEDDMIYIADSYNQRIQVLRYVGGPS